MAKTVGEPSDDSDGTETSRLHLEKPPLQTGRTEPDVSLRERAAMAEKPWVIRRRMAAFIALILIAILLVMGLLTIDGLSDFITRHYVAE